MHCGRPRDIFCKLCYYRVNKPMKITSYEVIKYAEKMSEGLPQYTAKHVFILYCV